MVYYSIRLLSVGCMAVLLSSCMLGFKKPLTSGYLAKKSVTQKYYPDGTPVKVGIMRPTPAWECEQVGLHGYNWEAIKVKTFNINSYGYLVKQALNYGGANNIKANYIFIDIPEQISYGSINLTAMSDANAYYYQCKYVNPN